MKIKNDKSEKKKWFSWRLLNLHLRIPNEMENVIYVGYIETL